MCDITNYNEIKGIINKQAKIDILVNNAGNNRPEHFTKVKKADMDYIVNLNLKACFNIAQIWFKLQLKSFTQTA